MEIIMKNSRRVLKRCDLGHHDLGHHDLGHHDLEVDIDNGDILEYQGIYYKEINDIQKYTHIKTMFIGKVCEYRSDTTGITGIYVEPLYIYADGWKKIMNYEKPKTYYFSYPHLLMLPENQYRHLPIYTLDTCRNRTLEDFVNITEEFYL